MSVLVQIKSVLMCSTIICLVSHVMAKYLLKDMSDVGSCHYQFCLMLSIRLCLVSHDIVKQLLTVMTDVVSCPN